jgi:Large ribosomal RNA subunit accumulation protein YceD
MTPELTRPVRVQHIGAEGMSYTVVATEAECRDLAVRFKIPAVLALRCEFNLKPPSGAFVEAIGRLVARVVQSCVVSLDEFEQDVVERFEIRFVPDGAESDDFDPDVPDDVPYSGAVIDLGETAAEQLALALDPYPRKPSAGNGGIEAAPSSPFSLLPKLREQS